MAAFIGCGTYLAMLQTSMVQSFALWAAAILVVAARLMAWRGDWEIK